MDLEQIHLSLLITTNIINLLRDVERYFGGNANYARGKGAEFMNLTNCYHPTAYCYAVSWACGGSRQDIGVEGAIFVLMNVPYYLEFLIWRMWCGHGDGILERNLFMMLQSVEMIAFFRVLSILHIAVCMPLQWLAGNCGNLYQHKFGVAETESFVDITDKELYEVLINGEKLIDIDFMMCIFDGITKNLPSLQEYLKFMFCNNHGSLVGSLKEDDNVLPWDILGSELFYPTRKDIVDTKSFLLNSHAKQRQSSELSLGMTTRPQLSTYLQSVGRRS